MADESRIDIEIAAKQTGDGLAKAEKGVRNIGDAAKKASSSGVAGWKAFAAASKTVQAAIHGVKAAFGPLLIAADIVTNLVRKFKEWRASIAEAAAEARRLRDEQDALARAEGLAKTVEAYSSIAKSAREAAAEVARSNELEDIALANARRMRDARLDLAEQKELEGASTDAERAEINARYAARRARNASGDAASDARDRSGREWKAAEAMAAEADAIDEAVRSGSADADARLTDAREKLEAWFAHLNRVEEREIGGAGGMTRTVRHKATKEETEEYERRKAALEAEAAAAEARFAAMDAQARELRAQSGHLAAKSRASLDEAAAADVSGKAKAMAADRTHARAKERDEAEKAAIRKAERDSRRFPMEMAYTKMQMEDEDERLARAARAKESESADAWAAKNRLDAAAANRGRGSRSESDYKAALAAYEKELAEEREAMRAFERVSREHANNVRVFATQLKEQEKRLDAANALLSRTQGYTGNE